MLHKLSNNINNYYYFNEMHFMRYIIFPCLKIPVIVLYCGFSNSDETRDTTELSVLKIFLHLLHFLCGKPQWQLY